MRPLIIIGIVVLLICVALSGCIQKMKDKKTSINKNKLLDKSLDV